MSNVLGSAAAAAAGGLIGNELGKGGADTAAARVAPVYR